MNGTTGTEQSIAELKRAERIAFECWKSCKAFAPRGCMGWDREREQDARRRFADARKALRAAGGAA